MNVVKPSGLWFDYCERVGLDPYDMEQPDYIYFKKLYNRITPHQRGKAVLYVERCWVWRGSFNKRGYPYLNGKLTNRAVYIYFKGPVESGKKLFRICFKQKCVNPDHANQLTQQEVLLAGKNTTTNKTHCPAGHPYDAENTYRDPTGRRRCRLCGKSSTKTWKAKVRREKLKVKMALRRARKMERDAQRNTG